MKKAVYLFLSFIGVSLIMMSCATNSPDLIVDYNSYFDKAEKHFDGTWLISEDSFSEGMTEIVEPYLNERMTSGYLDCDTGHEIYWESFRQDDAIGTVVMFHGFSEFTNKFNEQTYYFLQAGYSVVRFDHMGHGHSTRKVDNVSKVYTNEFDYYIEDANEIVTQVAIPLSDGKPMFLYAHSMGGGIGACYIEKYPDVFTKAALNCPMLEVNCGILNEMQTLAISRTMRAIGRGKSYIPGNKDYEYSEGGVAEDGSYGPTVSVQRNNYYIDWRNKIENYQSNGATYAWTDEAVSATRRIRSKKEASKVKIPVLLFQAENDVWVKPNGQYIFRDNASTVTIAYYPEVEHEIYASHDNYLFIYYDMILDFFAE